MRHYLNLRTRRAVTILASGALLLGGMTLPAGCGQSAPTGGTGTDPDTLSFKGVVSGTVADSRSTRESLDVADGASAAQALPPDIDPTNVRILFEDLAGGPLSDANGEPYPAATVDSNGRFTVTGLPVGVDFVVAVDLDGDGEVDVRQIVQIPADESGETGSIEDVMVDPLTTLIVGKLRALFEEHGVDLQALGISPTVIVQRVVDAFIHLFEESGIDQSVTLEDIAGLAAGTAGELFETILPRIVQAGIDTVEGNLALGNASEIEGVLRAAAEVFLRAGFPIVDDPGGLDLSFLADLPDVEVLSIDELYPPDDSLIEVAQLDALGFDQDQISGFLGDGTIDDLLTDGTIDDLLGDGTLDGFLTDGFDDTLLETVFGFDPEVDGERPVVYVSTVTEPDRNFAGGDEFGPGEDDHRLPFLNEQLIRRFSRLHIEGRTITLRDLYRVLTDIDVGMGVRLTYVLPRPEHEGWPPMVFETADGNGVERDIERALFELFQAGLVDPGAGFDDLASQTDQIRQTMRELLAGTVPPSFHRLFGAVASDRIESVDQLFNFVRKARAHLPFSRSGPSAFYVIADGDPFRPDSVDVNPVSVDLEFGPDGLPVGVIYNAAHTGTYYVGFTHATERDNLVEFLVRETGRFLHGPRGEPIVLDMGDVTLFDPINGIPFADFVSEEGTFWPGVPVSVANPEFRLDAEVGDGPTMQLFVLANHPGEGGEPVRVDYDVATGTFSASPNGRYYLMFVEETHELGQFGLYDIELNFMASVDDLSGARFVEGPVFFTEEPLPPPDATEPPPPDIIEPPPDVIEPPPTDVDGTVEEPPAPQEGPTTSSTEPPPPDGELPPPPDDGFLPPPEPEPIFIFVPALVTPAEVAGLDLQPEFFRFVFGIEVPNERFDPSGNPYFDDVNANGVEDPGEFTADFRPMLFNPDDWRSTDISRYYRRVGGGAVTVEEIDWESADARTIDGEVLVPRNFLPRLNAFRFGRPNTAINLLTTFLPPEFFNGTHSFNEDTPLGIFQALAMINLVMEQVMNVEAVVDFDGDGPFPAQRMLIDAFLFVLPIGDPLVLLLEGFETLSERRTE